MQTLMDLLNKLNLKYEMRGALRIAALSAVAITTMLSSGCMTPEDRAFYGRGWINPSELDQESGPPASMQDPTAVKPRMMGPGQY